MHVCPDIFMFKTNSTLDLVKLTSPDSAFQPLKNFYIHHWDGQTVQQSQPSNFDFVLLALECSGEPGTVNCLLSHHNVFYIFPLTLLRTNFTLSLSLLSRLIMVMNPKVWTVGQKCSCHECIEWWAVLSVIMVSSPLTATTVKTATEHCHSCKERHAVLPQLWKLSHSITIMMKTTTQHYRNCKESYTALP